jgi:hypothetical protein
MPNTDDADPRTLAVVDIDGVVADVRHRLHHIERRPKNWKAFFAAAGDDPPHAVGVELVQRLAELHRIVFLTGRPSNLRRVTEAWLAENGLGGHRLLMRGARDNRPAAIVKVEVLRRTADPSEVHVVIDDDPAVLRAIAAAGYATFLADWEPRKDSQRQVLRTAQEDDGRT